MSSARRAPMPALDGCSQLPELYAVHPCQAGVIEPLVALAESGPEADGSADAVAALRNLSRGNAENRDAIREAGGIVVLVKLLAAGSQKEITAHAAAALANLSFENRENQEAIRRAGGIRPLLRLLGQNKDVTTYAAGALANVANPAFALAGSCLWMCPPYVAKVGPPGDEHGM